MASQFLSLRQRCARLLSFRPSLEGLEPRCLMAVDAAMAPLHNSFDPEDVNDDGQCTPSDALVVINAINAKRPTRRPDSSMSLATASARQPTR